LRISVLSQQPAKLDRLLERPNPGAVGRLTRAIERATNGILLLVSTRKLRARDLGLLEVGPSGRGWWWPPETWAEWNRPNPASLRGDAVLLSERARRETDSRAAGAYARASIVLAVAAIEALSNDALISVYMVLIESWPDPPPDDPWDFLKRRSSRPVVFLLQRGSLQRKLNYLLRLLENIAVFDRAALEKKLKRATQARNRIVHMTHLWNDRKAVPYLNTRQVVHLAGEVAKTGAEFVDLIVESFAEVHLPIVTTKVE